MSPPDTNIIERTRLRLPIRLKLATVSAVLTFVILVMFALVVDVFTEQKIRAGFDDDLRATAADLQERIRVSPNADGEPRLAVPGDIVRAAAAGGAVIRVLDRNAGVIFATRSADLGPPVEGVRDVSEFRVVSRPLFAGSLDRTGGFNLDRGPIDGAVAFVQYAKPRRSVETTAARVRLFLGLGVLGGSMLALLAGLAVARRAMRPISDLTQAARLVAETRDPATPPIPKPEADDEVRELAETLEEMLRGLDAARSETEAALERQREFVADASHELRTPLTSILTNLELLEDELARSGGPSDPAEAAATASAALRSSRRMRRLVGDLLLLARADAGRPVARSPVAIAAVLRDAAREAAPLASGHMLTVDVADPDPLTVAGSADDLHRLALNLIENAYVHTPPGTPVVASARRAGDSIVIEVADRGPGIAADIRERVFERFARSGGQADRQARSGSGLGLAIVRAVADAHGGVAQAGEAPGGGALMTVTLPSSQGSPVRTGDGRVETTTTKADQAKGAGKQ